jgi:fatty acid synthase
VSVLDASGSFEVKEGGYAVCTGKIYALVDNEERIPESEFAQTRKEGTAALENVDETMVLEHVYKRFRFFGYDYTGLFQGILKVDATGRYFRMGWNDNWISYLDTLLQTTIRIYKAEGYLSDLAVPTEIGKLLVNPLKFKQNLDQAEDGVFANYNPDTHLIKCAGVEIEKLKMTKLSASRKVESPPVISRHAFEPYLYAEGEPSKYENFTPIQQCMSIIMDNFGRAQDLVTKYIPQILEICTKVPVGETLEISKAIRVHFAMPDVS